MEKAGKRGKIPQSDWPLIMARYEQGETLSSIARTYDCSPPAISYIVSRSREKNNSESLAPIAGEAQLVKTPTNGATGNGSVVIEPKVNVSPVPSEAPRLAESPAPQSSGTPGNGSETDGAVTNGEQRKRLHLSLGNGNGSHSLGNGAGHHAEPPARANLNVPRAPQSETFGNGHRPYPPPHNPSMSDGGRNGRDLFSMPESRPAAQQPRDIDGGRKEGGSFIDNELRARVDGDIAAFLAAFDAALAADTHESRFGLREATDRLLRAGARTRIELERLEARVPLTPREGAADAERATAWRYR